MAKTRKKKYNPAKYANVLARSVLRGTAVTWVTPLEGKAYAEAWGINSKEKIKLSLTDAQIYMATMCKWAVFCAVFNRDQMGGEYVKGLWIAANEYYTQDQLAEFFQEQHTALWNECNPMHRLSLGWVAYPDGKERSDKEAIELLEKRDPWKRKSEWELRNED